MGTSLSTIGKQRHAGYQNVMLQMIIVQNHPNVGGVRTYIVCMREKNNLIFFRGLFKVLVIFSQILHYLIVLTRVIVEKATKSVLK